MRLINTSTLTLRDFPFGNIPPYSILSHTWGAGEVTFEDFKIGGYEKSLGWEKIQRFCATSRELGFEFGWVDTCCIDKSSSAELSEAINSMFQWYKSSAICLAYLNDVGPERPIDDVRHCRWSSRGWTLQELIAPSEVEFYDSEWNHRGSKSTHSSLLSEATGVPESILIGFSKLQDCSVASRLSWASKRNTTRPEDIAYCLLGIFDVNMPLLYGEGPKAFRRLQETILHHNNDITLFAWGRLTQPSFTGVLAESISSFQGSGGFSPFYDDSDAISVTNRGLFFSGTIPIRVVRCAGQAHQYMLCLGYKLATSFTTEGIILTKIDSNTFCRCGMGRLPPLTSFSTTTFDDPLDGPPLYEEVVTLEYTNLHLVTDPTRSQLPASRHRQRGIHFPEDPALVIKSVAPHRLWDAAHRMFLRPKLSDWDRPIPQVIGLRVEYTIGNQHKFDLVILCDYQNSSLHCGIQLFEQCARPLRRAFDDANMVDSILWPDMGDVMGDKVQRVGDDHVDVSVDEGTKFRVRVCFQKQAHEMSMSPLQQQQQQQADRSPQHDQTARPGGKGWNFPTLRFSTFDISLSYNEAAAKTAV